MYYVRRGKIQLSTSNLHDDSALVVKEGKFFGETALILIKPRIHTATALEETELIVVDQKSFKANMSVNPVFAHIIKTILKRMKAITTLHRETGKIEL